MRLEVTVGCAACGFSIKISVNSNIDCDNLVCPGCGNESCMSIISVTKDIDLIKQNSLQRLQRIRQL